MNKNRTIIDFWRATEPFKLGQLTISTGTILTFVNGSVFIPTNSEIVELITNDRINMTVCQSCTLIKLNEDK